MAITSRRAAMLKQLAWLAGIWAASVTALGLVAGLLKYWIGQS